MKTYLIQLDNNRVKQILADTDTEARKKASVEYRGAKITGLIDLQKMNPVDKKLLCKVINNNRSKS